MLVQVRSFCSSNLSSRFHKLQGRNRRIKTVDDEYFGSSPLCLLFFICSLLFPDLDEGFLEAVGEMFES